MGELNEKLTNCLDIRISDTGDIMAGKGKLYFKKEGEGGEFEYNVLSAGEKECVDILLDLFLRRETYNDTIYCIDEPELHINTAIQRKMLVEIEKFIPDGCQLWVATHSIGFLRAMQEELKDKTQVIDFSAGNYFTGTKRITPMKPSRDNWKRIFGTALEDLTGLVAPKRIIYCEGRADPTADGQERGLDAKAYNHIFGENYHDALFISSGGNTELDQRSAVAIAILGKVFEGVEILVLKDRDMASGGAASEQDRQTYLKNNPGFHRVLARREIENYLFDKEVLQRYCQVEGLTFNETLYDSGITDIVNQPVKDDISLIRCICGVTVSVSAEVFKLNLSRVFSADMAVYGELEKCIFSGSGG